MCLLNNLLTCIYNYRIYYYLIIKCLCLVNSRWLQVIMWSTSENGNRFVFKKAITILFIRYVKVLCYINISKHSTDSRISLKLWRYANTECCASLLNRTMKGRNMNIYTTIKVYLIFYFNLIYKKTTIFVYLWLYFRTVYDIVVGIRGYPI